jgi:hypothetical protein
MICIRREPWLSLQWQTSLLNPDSKRDMSFGASLAPNSTMVPIPIPSRFIKLSLISHRPSPISLYRTPLPHSLNPNLLHLRRQLSPYLMIPHTPSAHLALDRIAIAPARAPQAGALVVYVAALAGWSGPRAVPAVGVVHPVPGCLVLHCVFVDWVVLSRPV